MRTALDYIEQYADRQLLCELLPACLSRPRGRRRSFCTSELLAAILRQDMHLRIPG
jgi:hypothetical protein